MKLTAKHTKSLKGVSKRPMIVFNPRGPMSRSYPKLLLAAKNLRPGQRVPAGVTLCAPDFQAFVQACGIYVIDEVVMVEGTPSTVTRPCDQKTQGARQFQPLDFKFLTAALGSEHPAFEAIGQTLKKLGLEPGAGDAGKAILQRNQAALRTIVANLDIFVDIINVFARYLYSVAPDFLDIAYVPPASLPGGFGRELIGWLLREERQAEFPTEKLDLTQGAWQKLYSDKPRRQRFATLVAAFEAVLRQEVNQFEGVALSDGTSLTVLAANVLADQNVDGRSVVNTYRIVLAAVLQIHSSFSSDAERAEVALFFIDQLYRPDLFAGIPPGLDTEGTRGGIVAQNVKNGSPETNGFAKPVLRGTTDDREAYGKTLANAGEQLFDVLVATDEASRKDKIAALPAELKEHAESLLHDPAVEVITEMAKNPDLASALAAVRKSYLDILTTLVLPQLFSPPKLDAGELAIGVKADLFTAAVLEMTVGQGSAAEITSLIAEHPLTFDAATQAIQEGPQHAASVAAGTLVTVVGNNEMARVVQNVLPNLAKAVDERPSDGIASIFPDKPARMPLPTHRTAADNLRHHPNLAKQVIRNEVERILLSYREDSEPVGGDFEKCIRENIPATRDEAGRWKGALVTKTVKTLALKPEIVLPITDRAETLDRTLSAVGGAYREHAVSNPLLKRRAESLVLRMILSSEGKRFGVGSANSGNLKLMADLMGVDADDGEMIRRTLPLSRYLTDEQIDKLPVVRRWHQVAAATRYPLARLIGDLYAMFVFLRELERTGEQALIFVGDAGQFLTWLNDDNLGPSVSGGLFRNGKLLCGEALPVTGVFFGSTAFSTITPKQFITQYRGIPLEGNGQSFVKPPVALGVGSADPRMAWADEGEKLSDEAVGDPVNGIDEQPVLILGPSPTVAHDPAVTIPASLLLATRIVGGSVADINNPGAGAKSKNRFVSLSGGVDMNDALDVAIYGPLTPEEFGVSARRAFVADQYAHIVLVTGAMLENANFIPAPAWHEIVENFVMEVDTADKEIYRDAAKVLAEACPGGLPRRMALQRLDDGWVVRVTISSRDTIDTAKTKTVAAYPVGQIDGIRRRYTQPQQQQAVGADGDE